MNIFAFFPCSRPGIAVEWMNESKLLQASCRLWRCNLISLGLILFISQMWGLDQTMPSLLPSLKFQI